MLLPVPGRAVAADPCANLGKVAPCVVVQVENGTDVIDTEAVDVQDIKGWSDIPNQQYFTCNATCHDPNDFQAEPRVASGLSVRALLQDLQPPVDPASVTYTGTVGRTPYVSKLSASTDDLGDSTDPDLPFQSGLLPAFFPVENGSAIGYIRPIRNTPPGDPVDQNYKDSMQTDTDGYFTLTVHESGTPLSPTIAAQPSTVKVGQDVAFQAAADDPDGSESLSYTWHFGDGATTDTDDSTADHSYGVAGTYYAYVEIAGSAGSTGESGTVLITVKPVKTKPPPTTPPPDSEPDPTPSGPSHGNGNSQNPTTGPISGSGHQGGAAPTTSSAGAPVTGSASSSAAGLPVSTAAPLGGATGRSDAAATLSSSARIEASRGDQVAGYLVAPVLVGAGNRPSTSGHPSQVTAPAARNGQLSPNLVGWLFGGLAVVLLLAFGARAEASQAPRPATRQQRRHR